MFYIIGGIFGIILGIGAGRGKKAAYSVGFWGGIATVVVAIWQTTLVSGLLVLGLTFVVALVAWFLALSTRVNKGLKDQ